MAGASFYKFGFVEVLSSVNSWLSGCYPWKITDLCMGIQNNLSNHMQLFETMHVNLLFIVISHAIILGNHMGIK